MKPSSPPSSFDIWMFQPGAVLGSRVRVYDVLFVGVGIIAFAILLILIIESWSKNSSLQDQIDELKQNYTEPMTRALDNTIEVFELREAKGAAHGYPSLNSLGKVPTSQLPTMKLSDSIPTRGTDASVISFGDLPNAEMKILRAGRCVVFKETNSYIQIDYTC